MVSPEFAKAFALATEQEGNASREVGLPESGPVFGARGDDAEVFSPKEGQDLLLRPDADRHAEDESPRSPHNVRVEEIHGGVGQEDCRHPERFGGAEEGPEVAWFFHFVGDEDERLSPN